MSNHQKALSSQHLLLHGYRALEQLNQKGQEGGTAEEEDVHHLTGNKKPFYTQVLCPFGHMHLMLDSIRKRWQCGRGKRGLFSEDVSNQLGISAHLSPVSSEEKGSLETEWCRGGRGIYIYKYILLCAMSVRWQERSTEGAFSLLQGFFSWSLWLSDSGCLVMLLNRLSPTSSSGLRSSATLTRRPQSLLCRLVSMGKHHMHTNSYQLM